MGAPNPKEFIILQFLFAENERIWAPGVVPGGPLDPPMLTYVYEVLVGRKNIIDLFNPVIDCEYRAKLYLLNHACSYQLFILSKCEVLLIIF